MWAPQPKYWLWMMSGATIRSISSRLLVCSQVGSRPSVSPLCGSVSKSGIGMKGAVAGLSQRASPERGGAARAAGAGGTCRARPPARDGRDVAMQSVAVQHPHLLIWREPPAWPFVWRGLLPLAALALTASFAAGPVARSWIEGAVQRETREQLDAAGLGWVGLSVSGQNLTLSGEEPAPGSGERAIGVAKAARCATWIGRRACAVSVAGRFTAPAPPAGGAAAPPHTAAPG